ncbi:MAG: TrkH family potassium uptake protein [Paracoccaceae bacterium]
MPLFLVIWGLVSLSMWVPATFALYLDDHPTSRSFFYAGILGLFCVSLITMAQSGRVPKHGLLGQLLTLFATLSVLPVFLAVPFHDALGTTSFLNAYFDMVSAVTTTGADLFNDPGRLSAPLHLWRAQVAWMGGLLMWIAAAAILAPLSLGGFEITARGQPGRTLLAPAQVRRGGPRWLLNRVTRTLLPIYAGLTGAVWIMLVVGGETPLTGAVHAMSVMSTSGISPVGGIQNGNAGYGGEIIIFLFMFFALSRLTFSHDTAISGYGRLDRDPEFRIGLGLVIAIPLLLILRDWLGSIEFEMTREPLEVLRAYWGAMFTILSFLSTTGFVSADWGVSEDWSGLPAPGIILLGLALIGGGVATTAGGVKLLRVYALYLNGLQEMQRLVHPSLVSADTGSNRRIQKNGAFIAWVFFMLFAVSLAAICAILALLGSDFEASLVMAVAALSTTGPLIHVAPEATIDLVGLNDWSKAALCFAMILGRLEALALIVLLTPNRWRR